MKPSEFEQTSFYRAICQKCRTKFAFPYTGDMNYGMLYFFGEQGTAFGFYEPLNHPLWEYVKKTINDNTTEELDSDKDHNVGARLQWVIARCADKIDNQKLTTELLCPQCLSPIITFSHNEFVEYRNIARVSFLDFEGLSGEDKTTKILNLYAESKNKFPPLRDERSLLSKFFYFVLEKFSGS